MELQTKCNAEIYIEKYKELEEVVRAAYNLSSEDSISYYLTKQDKYKNDKDEIAYCQQIRNLIQHKKKISNVYPIEPTNETIKYISLLIDRVKNKKKCCDICVKYNEIYQQTLDGKVKNAMSVMREKTFTCVPIIEGKKVIGVFDENALFEYIAAEEIVEIDENLTFRDIESYLSIDKREMEEFLFFGNQKLVEDLEIEFEKSFRSGKRVAAVFLTPSGKSTEDISGLITAWDILGNNSELS